MKLFPDGRTLSNPPIVCQRICSATDHVARMVVQAWLAHFNARHTSLPPSAWQTPEAPSDSRSLELNALLA